MPKLHWVLKAFLAAIVVAVALIVGGTIILRYSNSLAGGNPLFTNIGAVMFMGGFVLPVPVLVVALVRGWRRARRQKARGRGGPSGRPAAREPARQTARAPARR
jgi:hypothetical protein